jgi:putative ABC transport system substrate-binding protein
MQLHMLGVKTADELDAAFGGLQAARADALLVVGIGVIGTLRSRILALAAAARLPAIYSYVEFVSDGGLIAYAPKAEEQFRRAATYVDKILRGARPADLPVEQARGFELAVNLTTAKKIGIEIPRAVLARADLAIE